MAVRFGWAIFVGILNLALKVMDMFRRKRGSSEYRKDAKRIKDDPVDAFDNMFGGGVRDDRAKGKDADTTGKTGADPLAKS
jgi:hypothetical protein